MSRRVVDEVLRLNETHGFLRGLVALVGFPQTSVLYDREARAAGRTSYNRFLGSARIGLNGLVGFSRYPLHFISLMGLFFAGAAMVLGATCIALRLATVEIAFGNPTLVIIVSFFSGVQLLSIGVMGEYIGRIYDEVKRRPTFIVDELVGFDGGGALPSTSARPAVDPTSSRESLQTDRPPISEPGLDGLLRSGVDRGALRFTVDPADALTTAAVVWVAYDTPVDDEDRVEALLRSFCERIEWKSVESAEMTKHALNAFLARSVVFANEIAGVCERVGADAKDVERGLRSEARIGPKAYLAPSAAFAGETLARDVRFLTKPGAERGLETPLLHGVRASNERRRGWLARTLRETLGDLRDTRIAVWG